MGKKKFLIFSIYFKLQDLLKKNKDREKNGHKRSQGKNIIETIEKWGEETYRNLNSL